MHLPTPRGAALALAGAALLAGGATQADAATIHMKLKGEGEQAEPYFQGPKTVKKGAKLTIQNDTSVEAIGPHTFSLVKPSLLPRTEAEMMECGGSETAPPAGVCLTVAKAHEVDFQTFKVAKPIVEAGKKGWNTSFGKTGDSWYTETQGEKHSRRVTAKAGTTLTFFCAIHPFMTGKIKVTKK